jgi:hypothetical protein
MSLHKRDATQHAKVRRHRYRTAQECLARDRRQAQRAAEVLQQALDALGLPADLVTEIAGRLASKASSAAVASRRLRRRARTNASSAPMIDTGDPKPSTKVAAAW